jgi:hypothetical protein
VTSAPSDPAAVRQLAILCEAIVTERRAIWVLEEDCAVRQADCRARSSLRAKVDSQAVKIRQPRDSNGQTVRDL